MLLGSSGRCERWLTPRVSEYSLVEVQEGWVAGSFGEFDQLRQPCAFNSPTATVPFPRSRRDACYRNRIADLGLLVRLWR